MFFLRYVSIFFASLMALMLSISGKVVEEVSSKIEEKVYVDSIYEEVELTDSYENIQLDSSRAKLFILPSEGDKTKVVFSYVNINGEREANIEDNTLVLSYSLDESHKEELLNYPEGAKNKNSILVYIPQKEYKKVVIKANFDDFTLEKGIKAEDVKIINNYGDTSLSDVISPTIYIENKYGEISLSKLQTNSLDVLADYSEVSLDTVFSDTIYIATQQDIDLLDVSCNKLKINGKYGRVKAKSVKADDNLIQLETGDINIDDLSGKTLEVRNIYGRTTLSYAALNNVSLDSSSGNIDVSKSNISSLKVNSENGSATCDEIKGLDNITLSTGTGNVAFSDSSVKNSVKITTSTGNVSLRNITSPLVEVSTTNGSFSAEDIKGLDNISFKTSSGNFNLTDSPVKDTLNVLSSFGNITIRNLSSTVIIASTSSGNIKLNSVDGTSITLSTGTGNIDGTLLSPKKIEVTSKSSNNEIPESAETDSSLILTTKTGNIKIRILS